VGLPNRGGTSKNPQATGLKESFSGVSRRFADPRLVFPAQTGFNHPDPYG
jgi:hypothetical protein